MTGFTRVLIANRGEIACRIIRSVRALGYRSIAVYSAADAGAPHVAAADEAIAIGPAPAAESYLSIPRLMAAARASGAEAVHPGYGFLSENADFAEACAEAGLVFIGPSPAAIRAMGNKARAKDLALAAGVPCIPGYQGAEQSDARLIEAAAGIGYPIMVKAAAGGGGRGMRRVEAAEALPGALATARAEALAGFGSDELILEKAITRARHIEIQIFADARGNTIHLGERDCSIQRRHQKVIEEAPSPAVGAALRAEMGAVAVALAQAIAYVGAGTVEFLLDPDGAFYFLEMNTRLQVEHPVTEAVTGLDLVAWQLRIAAGEDLPLGQADIPCTGHAIEARLYAEDPARGFLPQTGTALAWEPPEGAGIRTDHGLAEGLAITPYYDPMIAKISAWGSSREEARRRLIAALESCTLLGLASNRGFLIDCLGHPVFAAGAATTAFLTDDLPPPGRVPPSALALALGAVLLFRATPFAGSPLLAGWRSTGPAAVPMVLRLGDERAAIDITDLGSGAYEVRRGATIQRLGITADDCRHLRFGDTDGQRRATYVRSPRLLHLALGAEDIEVEDVTLQPAASSRAAGGGTVTAPMNGLIRTVSVAAGDPVAKGRVLVVLEAMKMQHEILAPIAGTVRAVSVKPGDQVKPRAVLVEIEAEEAIK